MTKTLPAVIAAFLAVVLVAVAYVKTLTTLGTTERLAAGEIVEGIEVPVIGTVGDFPGSGAPACRQRDARRADRGRGE